MLESGVDVDKEIQKILCENGHQSFLKDKPWNVDETGHGTKILKLLTTEINPKDTCVVMYKVIDDRPRPEEYASALIQLSDVTFDVLLVAIEDVSYYLNEVTWYSKLTSKSKVVVAGGNKGKVLSTKYKCDTYPACLKTKLRYPHNFIVVGDTDKKFVSGDLIDRVASSAFENTYGTSFSSARIAAEIIKQQ